jgi:hypothetical protein
MRRAGGEDAEQTSVITWARWQETARPELKLLHHIPNGGSRNRIEAAKLKGMGVKAGVPDLNLPVPRGKYCGLWIEMKHGDGRVRGTQKEFMELAAAEGAYCVVCYDAGAAIEIITRYMDLKPISTGRGEDCMRIPNLSIIKDGKIKAL